MKVSIHSAEGNLLWERHDTGGLTSKSYQLDGTSQAIVEALKSALYQAYAQAGLSYEADIVADVGAAAA